MLDVWKKHITTAKIDLRHENPSIFIVSQWQKNSIPNIWYLIYRIFMTIFLISTWALSIIDPKHLDKPAMFRVKWLIYLTNWGFTMCTLQSVLNLIMLFKVLWRNKTGENCLNANKNLYKFYWAINIIAIDMAFAITALYWTVIYDPKTMSMDYLNILVHAFNSAAMLIEICIIAHPVQLTHCYLPFLFGFAYTLFSVIYHLTGGTSRDGEPTIYKVINWSRPMPTLAICVGAMCFLVVIHCCSYCFFRFRQWLARKLKIDSGKSQMPVQEVFKGFDNDFITTEA